MREAQFNFVDETYLRNLKKNAKKESHTVSVDVRQGIIRFSPAYIRDNALDGVFVKFEVDVEKKVIGWKILRERELSKLNAYRKLKLNSYRNKDGYKYQNCSVSIRNIVNALHLQKKSYVGLKVQKYNNYLVYQGIIHYIELT